MKEKETNPTMIISFERFRTYIKVNDSPPTSDLTNNLVEQLELQVKNLMAPIQKNIQKIPDNQTVKKSLWDLPTDINMTTAPNPALTLKTYKSAVQNQPTKST